MQTTPSRYIRLLQGGLHNKQFSCLPSTAWKLIGTRCQWAIPQSAGIGETHAIPREIRTAPVFRLLTDNSLFLFIPPTTDFRTVPVCFFFIIWHLSLAF